MYQDCTRIHQVDILLETIPPSKLWKYITSIKMTHTVCDIPYAVWNNQKCLIDVIERECECSSFLFPRNRNATKQLKSCGFIQQVILHKLKNWPIWMIFFSHCVFHDMSKNSTILDVNATRNAGTVNIDFNPSIPASLSKTDPTPSDMWHIICHIWYVTYHISILTQNFRKIWNCFSPIWFS